MRHSASMNLKLWDVFVYPYSNLIDVLLLLHIEWCSIENKRNMGELNVCTTGNTKWNLWMCEIFCSCFPCVTKWHTFVSTLPPSGNPYIAVRVDRLLCFCPRSSVMKVDSYHMQIFHAAKGLSFEAVFDSQNDWSGRLKTSENTFFFTPDFFWSISYKGNWDKQGWILI